MMPSDLNLRTDDITKAYPVREIVRKPSDPSSLRTDDIQPPKPRFTNREFQIHPDDPSAQPISITTNKLYTRDVAEQKRAIQPGVGREMLSLKISDIDGARPRKERSTPARDTNPLDPVYKLPSYEEVPIEPVKFRRDNMDTSDIFGTRPLDSKQQIPTRPIMQLGDIDGTSAKPAHRARNGVQLDALNVRDITDVQFKTKRTANPLEPEYVVSRASGLLTHHDWEYIDAEQAGAEKVLIGPVTGSRVRPPPRERPSSQQFALRTSDLAGTLKKVTPWQHSNIERREWRNVTDTQDIAGAQSGTRAKLQTTRCTDPVNPQYNLPGGDRPVTAPYFEHEVDPSCLPAAGATRKPITKDVDKTKYDIFTWKPLAQSKTSFGHGVSEQFVERMAIPPKSPDSACSSEASPVSPPSNLVSAEMPSLRLSDKSEVFARSAEKIVTPKISDPAPVEKLRPATQASAAASRLSVQERLEKWLQKEGDFYHTSMQSDVFHRKQFTEEEEREFAKKTTFSSFAAVNSNASRSEVGAADPVPRALPRARLPISKGTEQIVRAKNAHSQASYSSLERARVKKSEIDAVRGLK